MSKFKALICPSCGCNMVLRNGKYGAFYGCSDFPICKQTLTTRQASIEFDHMQGGWENDNYWEDYFDPEY